MGRVREHIKVNGRKCWTLFDTGARNTYIVPAVAAHLTRMKPDKPFRSAFGGSVKKSTEGALLYAQVHGHRIMTNAMVVDAIGADEEGKPIEILFGALAMQQWLDLTHYPKEFVEF